VLANWDPDAERQFLVRVKEQRHRALLAFCSPREPLNEDLLRELEVAGVRVVHLEYYRTEPPPQSHILPDYRRAGYQAVVTLLLAGYGPIYLAGMRGVSAPFAAMVTQGFTEALGDHDEAFDPDGMFLDVPPRSPDYDYDEKLRELARRVPPGGGVVGRSSNYADILAPYLREVGRRVPEDVGVLGVGTAAVETSSADALLFGPRRNLDLALAEVTRPDWRGVRELVAPRHVRAPPVCRARHRQACLRACGGTHRQACEVASRMSGRRSAKRRGRRRKGAVGFRQARERGGHAEGIPEVRRTVWNHPVDPGERSGVGPDSRPGVARALRLDQRQDGRHARREGRRRPRRHRRHPEGARPAQ
jgi:hypothetical protein